MKADLLRRQFRTVLARGGALGAALLSVSSCCPPRTGAERQRLWEERLDTRQLLELDPLSKITIKRDVHSIDIGDDAGNVTDAFHRTMTDPTKKFGLIHVMRKEGNLRKPFHLHERFQGRYALEDFIDLHGPFWDPVLRAFENQLTSDYGEISDLSLTPPPTEDARMTYRYLEGSPIAGSSTFIVHQVSDHHSRLTQIFEYQEQDAGFVEFFATSGLKLHDQVVYSQAKQTADLLGAPILGTDIPEAYTHP